MDGNGKKGKKANNIIEKNEKQKQKEQKDIPLKEFFSRTIKTYASLILWIVPPYFLGRLALHYWDKYYYDGYPQGWSWRPFLYIQVVTTRITYYVSRMLSYDVKLEKATGLVYPEPLGTIIIIPDCTAILEMLFITGMMMGFNLKMKIKTRLKWAAVLCGVIFVENIVRLVCNWPIAKAYGYPTWEEIHMAWWKTYQLIFVILLFVAWFALVGRKYSPFLDNDSAEKNTSSSSATPPVEEKGIAHSSKKDPEKPIEISEKVSTDDADKSTIDTTDGEKS